MVATKLLTIEDLATLDSAPERFELIEGVIVEVSPSKRRHAVYASRIHGRLFAHVDGAIDAELYIAEGGFIVSRQPDTMLAPDVALVLKERAPESEDEDGFVPFAPDLAVEVESPSNTQGELLRKVALYLAGGARLVWLVRPKHQTVTVFHPDAPERVLGVGDVLDGGDVVPGFALPLTDLFRPLLAKDA